MENKKNLIKAINLAIISLILLVSSIRLLSVKSNATDDYRGYAIYRNGVAFGLNDHAAIMYRSDNSQPDSVVHAGGYIDNVAFADWDTFIDGNSFITACIPNNCSIGGYRQLFASKARELVDISYTVFNQIDYSAGNQMWVLPENITDLRCDGVVEYIFEFYGFRVGGPNNKWDITRNLPEYLEPHKGFSITPRKQHTNLLTRITTTLGN
ncbi:MAG: hypothetical protein IJK13_04950 [Lachnospiraceae bacterium]|nr:hypothetical protein [Lachnospiraceae bacterium]